MDMEDVTRDLCRKQLAPLHEPGKLTYVNGL
jgi:hypothetical protein